MSKTALVLVFLLLSACVHALEDPSFGTTYYLNRLFHSGFSIDNDNAILADFALRFNYAGAQVASISGNKFGIERMFFIPLPLPEPLYMTARFSELSVLERQEIHNIYEFGYRLLPALGLGIIGEPAFDKSTIDIGYSVRFSLYNNYFIVQSWTLDYLYNEKTNAQSYYKEYPRKYVFRWFYRDGNNTWHLSYTPTIAGDFADTDKPLSEQISGTGENILSVYLKSRNDLFTAGFLLDYLSRHEQWVQASDQHTELLMLRPFINIPVLPYLSIDNIGMYVRTVFSEGSGNSNDDSYLGWMTMLTHHVTSAIDLQYGYGFLQLQQSKETPGTKLLINAIFKFPRSFYLKIMHSVRPVKGALSWDGSGVEFSYVF